MTLGTWVYTHDHRIDGAPEDILVAAFAHIERRLVQCRQNARGRAQQHWLGRWARMIDRELAGRPT